MQVVEEIKDCPKLVLEELKRFLNSTTIETFPVEFANDDCRIVLNSRDELDRVKKYLEDNIFIADLTEDAYNYVENIAAEYADKLCDKEKDYILWWNYFTTYKSGYVRALSDLDSDK